MSATWPGSDSNGEGEESRTTTEVGLAGKAASVSVMNFCYRRRLRSPSQSSRCFWILHE
jgi:hypothetical protein